MTRAATGLLIAIAVSLLRSHAIVAERQDTPAPPPGDPIQCWWRTSAGAVAIGEPFDLALTCDVQDEPAVRTIVDEGRLGAGAIQLAPFEIIGDAHPEDIRRNGRRFFQYRYTLRVIDADLIGKDARPSDLAIEYRIETADTAGAPAEGRSRRYLLPAQPVRVLSLVPAGANDIRDSSDENFARVAALRLRSRTLQLIAIVLAAVSLVVLGPAIVRLGRRVPRAAGSGPPGRPGDRAILTHLVSALAEVQRQSRGGWTPELAHTAASALRIAAACATGRPLSQRPCQRDHPPAAGRLILSTGLIKRPRVSVSSPVTAADLERALAAGPASADERRVLEDLRKSLHVLTVALYRPAFDSDSGVLDEALASGLEATRRVRRARTWPQRWLRSGRAPAPLEARA